LPNGASSKRQYESNQNQNHGGPDGRLPNVLTEPKRTKLPAGHEENSNTQYRQDRGRAAIRLLGLEPFTPVLS